MFAFISDEVMKSEPGAVATGSTSSQIDNRKIGNENTPVATAPVLTAVHVRQTREIFHDFRRAKS